MIGSYIKTSGRNLIRNKLFSSINIVSLAISMSVGLLLIAFVLDLRSYDRFHQHGEWIYRITSVETSNREQSSKFSSASIKSGKADPRESDQYRGSSHSAQRLFGG